jgi:hypothetical protein
MASKPKPGFLVSKSSCNVDFSKILLSSHDFSKICLSTEKSTLLFFNLLDEVTLCYLQRLLKSAVSCMVKEALHSIKVVDQKKQHMKFQNTSPPKTLRWQWFPILRAE